MIKRKLVKEYELKRDVFEFKKRGTVGKEKEGDMGGRECAINMGSILTELEKEQ